MLTLDNSKCFSSSSAYGESYLIGSLILLMIMIRILINARELAPIIRPNIYTVYGTAGS